MSDWFREAEKAKEKEDFERGPWRMRMWGYNWEVFDERTEKRHAIYTEKAYAKYCVAALNYREHEKSA